MANRQTMEQERAKRAWDCIATVKQKDDDKFKKRYNGLARGLPAMIQGNGLGQSLAFLRARDKGKHDSPEWLLYSHLSRWVTRPAPGEDGNDELLEWLVQQPSSEYRRKTVEVMAFAEWLKRFAEAELPAPEGDRR